MHIFSSLSSLHPVDTNNASSTFLFYIFVFYPLLWLIDFSCFVCTSCCIYSSFLGFLRVCSCCAFPPVLCSRTHIETNCCDLWETKLSAGLFRFFLFFVRFGAFVFTCVHVHCFPGARSAYDAVSSRCGRFFVFTFPPRWLTKWKRAKMEQPILGRVSHALTLTFLRPYVSLVAKLGHSSYEAHGLVFFFFVFELYLFGL